MSRGRRKIAICTADWSIHVDHQFIEISKYMGFLMAKKTYSSHLSFCFVVNQVVNESSKLLVDSNIQRMQLLAEK